ncbi:MAG: radical SAM protein, partial [Campylobacterales bacterium]
HLIKRIELIEGVQSARILYLYPTTTSMKLLETIAASKRFHNYFDMPIQHIDDAMLKIMKRGAGREQTEKLLHSMRKLPESFVRTSFIVGHPGETEESFASMCDFARTFGFDRINVFAYSDEEGTSACERDDKVDPETIEARAEILGEIAEEAKMASLQKMVGREITLVIDGESDEHEYLLSARDLRWAPEIDGEIYVNDNALEEPLSFGVPYKAKITDLVGDKLTATVTGHAG